MFMGEARVKKWLINCRKYYKIDRSSRRNVRSIEWTGELEFMKKLSVLLPLWPVFMSYVLGFIYVGICWNKLRHAFTQTR
jgi:hypothetical protein